MIRFASVLLLLAACGPDVSITKSSVDADSDGYDASVDCDDAQVDVNPDAPEVCDGQDNDCDGVVDEDAVDAVASYADTDGDGFGDPGTATEACDTPTGRVVDATDCDDADASAFPGNPEVCDGVDNDCDGAVDDDASDLVVVYLDADGDGYGDPATAHETCAAGTGEVTVGDDCDDADPAIHPDAAEADCTDPTDYNCDGSVGYADADGDGVAACEDCDDEDAARSPDLAELCDAANRDEDCDDTADDDDTDAADPSTWYRDIDGDGYASASGLSVTQCDAPAGYVAVTGDCDDYNAGANPGAAEVCDAGDLDEDCDGAADDSDTSTDPTTWQDWHRDADGDGYGDPSATISLCDAPAGWVADALDCDDAAAAVHPSAVEVCDAADVDEDCDGLTDDADPSAGGGSTWYQDADGDGYGGPTRTSACDPPAGHLATSTDCDDGDAAIHPAATERCDAADVDEDCDGLADDADPGVTGTVTFHPDADRDGYGAETSTTACDVPSGSVTDDTDCDDASASVNPAGTERCDAADVDEDCDGLVDDADPSVTGGTAWYRDADADGYGGTTRLTACDAPAGYDAESSDCDDVDATTHPGAVETCEDGIDQDCSGADEVCPSLGLYGSVVDTDADAVLYGPSAYSRFGTALVTGDFDGDGRGDLVVSATSDTTADAASGVVYGYTTVPTSGVHEAPSIDTFSYYNTSSTFSGAYGSTLGNVGDLDEDGRDDLFVQAALTNGFVLFGGDTGAAPHTTADITATCYIGRAGGSVASGAPTWLCGHMYAVSGTGWAYVYAGTDSVPTATFTGETVTDFAGQGVGDGGDVDGDGFDDLWIGAPHRDESSTNTGTAYLFYGPVSGTASLAAADVRIRGGSTNDYLGSNFYSPGDVDGDGHDDIAIGKLGGDLGGTESGTVHILTSPSSGVVTSLGGITLYGDDPDDYLGQYDPAFGDANGDGVVDALLTAPRNDDGGTYGGSAWVVYGPLAGTIDLSSADAEIVGTTAWGLLGTGGMFLPDINGDGCDEIAVSAYTADVEGLAARGAAWIFLGG